MAISSASPFPGGDDAVVRTVQVSGHVLPILPEEAGEPERRPRRRQPILGEPRHGIVLAPNQRGRQVMKVVPGRANSRTGVQRASARHLLPCEGYTRSSVEGVRAAPHPPKVNSVRQTEWGSDLIDGCVRNLEAVCCDVQHPRCATRSDPHRVVCEVELSRVEHGAKRVTRRAPRGAVRRQHGPKQGHFARADAVEGRRHIGDVAVQRLCELRMAVRICR